MNSFFTDIQARFKTGDILTKVISVNVALYLIIVLINVGAILFSGSNSGSFVQEFIYPFLEINSNFSTFIFKPWTLITHQFVHSLGIGHILGNMLLLYFLGKMFLNYFSPKQFLSLYLLGGILGAVFLLVVANLSPLFDGGIRAVGASASVMAIAIAVCSYTPKNQIFLFGMFKVQLQWVGVFLVLYDLLYFGTGNEGGHLAHLMGAATGFAFGRNLKKGKDITSGVSALISKFSTLNPFSSKAKKMTVEYRKDARFMSDEEYNKRKHVSQETVDEILDKISKSGYDSLSKAEKEMLFKYSNK